MVNDFPRSDAADELLEQLLSSLLGDFRFWFERGQHLLALCPDLVMAPEQRLALDRELSQAHRELHSRMRQQLQAVSQRYGLPMPKPRAQDEAPKGAPEER